MSLINPLGEDVRPRGIGLDIYARLVERNEFKAIYLRDDGVYEWFYRKQAAPAKIYGKDYPAREIYPSNEDFGSIAWNTHIKEHAMKGYHALKEKVKENDEKFAAADTGW